MPKHEVASCLKLGCAAYDKLAERTKEIEAQLREGHCCQSFDMCGDAHEKYEEQIKELKAENKQLRAIKCPPISDGDTCICPIEELEEALNKAEVVLLNYKPKMDEIHNVLRKP